MIASTAPAVDGDRAVVQGVGSFAQGRADDEEGEQVGAGLDNAPRAFDGTEQDVLWEEASSMAYPETHSSADADGDAARVKPRVRCHDLARVRRRAVRQVTAATRAKPWSQREWKFAVLLWYGAFIHLRAFCALWLTRGR